MVTMHIVSASFVDTPERYVNAATFYFTIYGSGPAM
jgi:hypothetical protein